MKKTNETRMYHSREIDLFFTWPYLRSLRHTHKLITKTMMKRFRGIPFDELIMFYTRDVSQKTL